MKDISNCRKVTQGVDYVFNMACNMGGMGFIENNKAECMLSVLINTNLLIACNENKIQDIFFSSSACAYNTTKQQDVFIEGLKEEDAYLRILKMDMVGKNYLVRECADTLWKIMGWMLELQGIIIYTDPMELLMVEEKKHQQHYV